MGQVRTAPALAEERNRTAAELASLPEATRALEGPVPVPVRVSDALREAAREVDRRTGGG
jgi:hypothetical protein